METGPRSPARLLAPIALVAFALALVVVVAGSVGSDDGDEPAGGGGEPAAQQETTETEAAEDEQPGDSELPRFYTVQTGDTLAGIADEHGVSVERLQELNPALDPQALVSGQRIRLKE